MAVFSLPVPPRPLSADREKKAHKLSRRRAARTARGRCRHERAQVGRGSTARTDAENQAAAIRQEERWRRELERYRAEQEALRKARDEETARRDEREYRRAIATGGAVAANARWERLYDETLDKYGGRYALCQWEDEDANGNFLGRRCTRRTADVYCWRHNRQLERESERRRREKERASTTPTTRKE